MKKIVLKDSYTIEDLLDIMEALRSENGCEWDKVQTHDSIKSSMIEESYEAIDALENNDDELFANELGDLLLQVVFHAQMAKERGAFDFDKVVYEICNKLITRHTHVFGDDKAGDSAAALERWEENKRKEKSQKTVTESLLDVPKHYPSLMRAQKVQKKAAKVGFDWPDISGAADKCIEEARELKEAISGNDKEHMSEELGDLMFSCVNVSRFLGVDSEEVLRHATDKFIARFKKVEQLAQEKEANLSDFTIEELDEMWDAAKKE